MTRHLLIGGPLDGQWADIEYGQTYWVNDGADYYTAHTIGEDTGFLGDVVIFASVYVHSAIRNIAQDDLIKMILEGYRGKQK